MVGFFWLVFCLFEFGVFFFLLLLCLFGEGLFVCFGGGFVLFFWKQSSYFAIGNNNDKSIALLMSLFYLVFGLWTYFIYLFRRRFYSGVLGN